MTPEQQAIEQELLEGIAHILGDLMAASPPQAEQAAPSLVGFVIAHLEDFEILAEARDEPVPDAESETQDPLITREQS